MLPSLRLDRAVLLALLACGCAAPLRPLPPVPRSASEALAESRRLSRRELAGAREAATRALSLAPGWAAAQRVLDDLDREALLGPRALQQHRAVLAEDADDPRHLYLAARLTGEQGYASFERVTRLAPRFAWGWNGLAYVAERRGDPLRAAQLSRRALGLARDPGERAFFLERTASLLTGGRQRDAALELLSSELDGDGRATFYRDDLLALEALRARFELEDVLGRSRLEPAQELRRQHGLRRALALVREPDVAGQTLRGLVRLLEAGGPDDELRLALGSHPGREELLSDLLRRRGERTLARAYADAPSTGQVVASPAWRANGVALGGVHEAVEAWHARLPAQVLGEDGLPLGPELRRLVRSARRDADESSLESARALGDAFIEAGWFREARAFAVRLAGLEAASGIDLYRRALAGQLILWGIERLAREADGQTFWLPDDGSGASSDEVLPPGQGDATEPARAAPEPSGALPGTRGSITARVDLDGFLAAVSELLARIAADLGSAPWCSGIAASPRIGYSVVGSVVHPGPTFSGLDEQLGLGRAGEPVGGWAELCSRLGRFGLLGELGGKPDVTVLRKLCCCHERGAHLGTAFEGSAFWCEGADVPGRAARRGAAIAGAALHEGYYVDLAPLRRTQARWAALASGYEGEGARARVEEVLAQRALPLLLEPGDDPSTERTATAPVLGAAQRLRLQLLLERGPGSAGAPLGEMTLEELCELTAVHEQGHLCDRTRFYPLHENLGQGLRFLWDSGFSAARIAQRLEYRAQLVALCELPDPRLALVDLLDAAEAGGRGITPHAAAYVELLRDLMRRLELERTRDPEAWPDIDPDRMLIEQLRRIPPERLRALGYAVARDEGLVARGFTLGELLERHRR